MNAAVLVTYRNAFHGSLSCSGVPPSFMMGRALQRRPPLDSGTECESGCRLLVTRSRGGRWSRGGAAGRERMLTPPRGARSVAFFARRGVAMNVEGVELDRVEMLVSCMGNLVAAATEAASKATGGGKGIDDAQVLCERVAYAATELAAARALLDYAREAASAGADDADLYAAEAAAFTAQVAGAFFGDVVTGLSDYRLDEKTLDETWTAEATEAVRHFGGEALARAIGARVIESRGVNNGWMPSEDDVMVRDSVRAFANQEVAPVAEHIHRNDDLVPDELIAKMAEMGYFGMGIPQEYGGLEMGNLAMILTTEELSRVSLAAAGSLITRPEILTKALLKGGTEEQKRHWLERVATGEVMVGISVTEPDVGSDVASVACRAEPAEVGGVRGYLINGAKAWCTFAGRADVLALLARTDPDPKSGARGLSLFIVEKDRFYGHEFEMRQPSGGLLYGKADATPGYRGMHSFTLSFEDYFVPADRLVGGEAGLGKGFYLQMGGFAAGRLQTGGRATGLGQASLEAAAGYVGERRQFGRPIGDFQLTRYKLGRMASELQAARQLTYRAARAMDADETISLEPAMAKLLACDVAVRVSQEAQLLHGGWGYAEEYPISRYVVDALVLPIFEGVKPILELKVIGRQLLAA
ncbi:MAG: acyl-CoA dehydrogenase [Deltaproteobacteria bacterium]|nr:MAG: acyl-CoA dehydrogenase [Deltaproteobacteria bacterium]